MTNFRIETRHMGGLSRLLRLKWHQAQVSSMSGSKVIAVLLQARRIQIDSSSYRCNSRIIVHLERWRDDFVSNLTPQPVVQKG